MNILDSKTLYFIKSSADKDKIKIVEVIDRYVPEGTAYLSPTADFNFKAIAYHKYIKYPSWVQRFLSLVFIKGQSISLIGYDKKESTNE